MSRDYDQDALDALRYTLDAFEEKWGPEVRRRPGPRSPFEPNRIPPRHSQTAAGPPLRGAFYSQEPPMEAVRGPDGVWSVPGG